ncbi:MAG TPA: hypothetical protein VMS18_11500 [Candidatus Binatia bacterium]|nr:hypothetical protein [Candidatus Binatia bacterium]
MKHKVFAAFVALALCALQSHAQIMSAATRDKPNFYFDAKTHVIPLTEAGATSISFTTTQANQRVAVSFSAECSVGGVHATTYLDLDILVDGVAAPPSDSDNAFCAAHADPTAIRANWVSAITVVVTTVPTPGQHVVQVRGTLRNMVDGDSWSVDDSATLVSK